MCNNYYSSLRCYILGKHSNTVFSINRNTAGSDESLLLDCLSSNTLKQSKIFKDYTLPENDILNEEVAHIESDFGTSDNFELPETSVEFELLKKFEKEVSNIL